MRRVLVTGAGRNIGRAVAEAFADLGDLVAVNARSEIEIGLVAAGITERGGEAIRVAGDISTENGVHTVVDSVVAQSGGAIDVLVHCATSRLYRRIEEMTLREWHETLRVGLDGAFLCSRSVLPAMAAAGWGRVILMTGLRGHTGNPGLAAVAATKSGMTGLMKALAHEYAGTGVTVNAVSPGRINTTRDQGESGDASGRAEHNAGRTKGIPMGRMGDCAEVAAACVYLASELAGFVTGQTVHVNGGVLMP